LILLKQGNNVQGCMLRKRTDEVSGLSMSFCFDTNIHMAMEWCSSEAILASCLNICLSD